MYEHRFVRIETDLFYGKCCTLFLGIFRKFFLQSALLWLLNIYLSLLSKFSMKLNGGRFAEIDTCRGLLFFLMANTHALTIAGVEKTHWLFSDIWFPNGWATVVFVVLSGYGIGYIFLLREPERLRNKTLYRRAVQILAVMFGSNYVFAALREVAAGNFLELLMPGWWFGFFTLDSAWTISGVLLPTAFVLLLAPFFISKIRAAPWMMLSLFLIFYFFVVFIKISIKNTGYESTWLARILLFEGLGGFPLLPFLLNGAFGVWLGIIHRLQLLRWPKIIFLLIITQMLVFITAFSDAPLFLYLRAIAGPVGKFGCLFFVTLLLMKFTFISSPFGLIGRYALGSFIMHRIFLQALGILVSYSALQNILSPAMIYALLLGGTMFLTWGLCNVRDSWQWIDIPFRRLAL